MASPTTAGVGSSSAAANAGRASVAPISTPYRHLTKDFIGTAVEPGAGEDRLAGAELARRVDWTGAPRPLDLRQQIVFRGINPDDREGVIGSGETEAGADQLWRHRRVAGEQPGNDLG